MPAHAQALPAGVRLGMSAEELRSALPDVERVARPQRLAGGLAGTWRAAPVALAGLPFDLTFFFADGQLQRIEYAAAAQPVQTEPDRGAAAFAQLLDWGRATFGPEVGARDPGSAYAAWVAGDADVYLQRTDGARGASVRLVYKLRQLKDGSAL
ncbi:hypothetical protein [Variovorax ginsengisoli]|nr:hypothetical protein [Variovorax ginsengisoli]